MAAATAARAGAYVQMGAVAELPGAKAPREKATEKTGIISGKERNWCVSFCKGWCTPRNLVVTAIVLVVLAGGAAYGYYRLENSCDGVEARLPPSKICGCVPYEKFNSSFVECPWGTK